MLALMDKACNCETQQCIDDLKGEFGKIEAGMKDYKPSSSDLEKVGEMMQKQEECEAKLKAKGLNME